MISPTKRADQVLEDGLGGGERKAFTMNVNGKAFRVLMDGMYENKIGAVVREIMSNGYDAHAAYGTPEVPVKVTAPTQLDPTFRVRDYGVSMCHEDIMTLYTSFFSSTKEGTNDQMGQFGLGSKTPFAYTDTFSVTAWLKGEKRVYVAHIDNDGVPQLTFLGTEDQGDEPQGIEITVPAQTHDIHTFRQEIARMALASDVMPELDGMSVPDNLVTHQGEGFRVVRDTYSTGSYAVRQGCVVYPVHSMRSNMVKYGYTLIVDVPIGSVEVTASREALSLTPETNATIKAALATADAALKDYQEELNANFPNRLAAFHGRTSHEWLNGDIGRGVITLAPDKPNPKVPAQSLITRYTASKERQTYQIQNPNSWMVLVDSGEPMLRRQKRIAAFFKNAPYGSIALVQRHELPRLVRLTGIAPKQVRTLQDIPDVPIVVGPRGASGKTGVAAKPKLAKGEFWSIKEGTTGFKRSIGGIYFESAKDFFQGRVQKSYYHNVPVYDSQLRNLGFKESQVVFVTQNQKDAMAGLDDTNNFDLELIKRCKDYAKKNKLQERLNNTGDETLVRNFSAHWTLDGEIKRILGKASIDNQLMNMIIKEAQTMLEPLAASTAMNVTDDFVIKILELKPVQSLTKADLLAKLVATVDPYRDIVSQPNPLAFLVKFYTDNK